MVARSFKQREGVRFGGILLRRMHLVFVCWVFFACELGLGLCHFDAEQAFVQPTLEENILSDYLRVAEKCQVILV